MNDYLDEENDEEYLDEEYFFDDDELYEPTEAEAKLKEITDILKESVRQDIKDEIKRLREENAELQQYKDKQMENDAQLAQALRDLKREKTELEKNIKKARIKELFGDYIVTAWVVQRVFSDKPKCDKCNAERKLEFYSPRGKKHDEPCECADKTVIYKPQPTQIIRIETDTQWGEVKWRRVYLTAPTIWSDGTKVDNVESTTSVYDGRAFGELNWYSTTSTVFLDESKCQEFCDYLNNKEKEKGKGN